LGEKSVFVLINADYSYIIEKDFSVTLLKNTWGDKKLTQENKDSIINVFGGLTVYKSGLSFYSERV
jgi:hypothetical protein